MPSEAEVRVPLSLHISGCLFLSPGELDVKFMFLLSNVTIKCLIKPCSSFTGIHFLLKSELLGCYFDISVTLRGDNCMLLAHRP